MTHSELVPVLEFVLTRCPNRKTGVGGWQCSTVGGWARRGGPDKHQPTFAVRRDSPLGSTVVGRDLGGSKIEGGWSPFLRVAEAGGVSGIFTGAVGITDKMVRFVIPQ